MSQPGKSPRKSYIKPQNRVTQSLVDADSFYVAYQYFHEYEEAIAKWRLSIDIPYNLNNELNNNFFYLTSIMREVSESMTKIHVALENPGMAGLPLRIISGMNGYGTTKPDLLTTHESHPGSYEGFFGEPQIWKKVSADVIDGLKYKSKIYFEPSGEDPNTAFDRIVTSYHKLKTSFDDIPSNVIGDKAYLKDLSHSIRSSFALLKRMKTDMKLT